MSDRCIRRIINGRIRPDIVGLAQFWPQAAILTGFALLLVTVSVKRFSKTME